MLFFIFLAAARKIARLPEKNYFARLWGAAAPLLPPSSYADGNMTRYSTVDTMQQIGK